MIPGLHAVLALVPDTWIAARSPVKRGNLRHCLGFVVGWAETSRHTVSQSDCTCHELCVARRLVAVETALDAMRCCLT